MDLEFVVLRVIHIGFGAFWFGTAVFMAAILEPRLRELGPEVQKPLMGALMPVLNKALTAAGTITIAAGVYILLRMKWGNLDHLYNTDWGRSIVLGLAVTVIAMGTGAATGAQGRQMAQLGASIEGRPPTPEEAAQLQLLSSRLRRLVRTTAVLLFIAVAAMASARWV